jgi:hypothetical protein
LLRFGILLTGRHPGIPDDAAHQVTRPKN